MRGLISAGGYVPHHRLDRADIAAVVGGNPGRGSRAVASFDEDTTTMGVEAARLALRSAPDGASPASLGFATADPAYLDKTNATAIHAALRFDSSVPAFDMGGAPRSGIGALRGALAGGDTPTLVVLSDTRGGLPTSADESQGGDGAAALLVGDGDSAPLLAEYLGGASATEEFLDRWRLPGERRSKQWEERFGETMYRPLGEQAWNAALKNTGLTPADVDRVVLTGTHARAVRGLGRRLGVDADAFVDDLSGTVGNTGTAHPGLLLTAAVETAEPNKVIAVISLSDGADVLLFRTTDAVATWEPARSVAAQIETGGTVPYGKYLAWRGELTLEPPRRPEPARPSASASARNEEWKFAFVGSRDQSTGALHVPPQRASWKGGAIDEMDPAPMADVPATILTFTVDRLAYSQSPPIVFAVLDFDGGGRLPSELTDVAADEVAIGDRVEMTFRRLFTADGIHNYFWKARPIRSERA